MIIWQQHHDVAAAACDVDVDVHDEDENEVVDDNDPVSVVCPRFLADIRLLRGPRRRARKNGLVSGPLLWFPRVLAILLV